MFCLNDNFFDIVFDLYINDETYNFKDPITYEGEYHNKTEKYACKIFLIGITGFILLGCIYTLIFILFPIIKFRIAQYSRKRQHRYSEIGERLGSSKISLMRERLNSENF